MQSRNGLFGCVRVCVGVWERVGVCAQNINRKLDISEENFYLIITVQVVIDFTLYSLSLYIIIESIESVWPYAVVVDDYDG